MKRTVLETSYFVVIPSSVLNAGSDFSDGLKEIVGVTENQGGGSRTRSSWRRQEIVVSKLKIFR